MHSFTQLSGAFEKDFPVSSFFPEAPESLYEPCRYLLQLGGKRIRPVLCLMGNELFGEITADAWHAAHAIELFHNFTLIHDDIMDNAPLRRGQPTLHEKYGMTSGILGGDVMCIYAYEQLANIKNPILPQILKLFNRTAIEVCEGQQLDMDFESREDVKIEDYIEMIGLKTSVLLACSLKMGALLNGALGDNANKLYEFGKNMGISFQLQDDYLDAFGDAAMVGKQTGGDIKANKKTFLLLKALENATAGQRMEIHRLLRSDDDNKVADMLQLFRDTKADAACKQEMERYSALAFEYLDEVAMVNKRKEPLRELAAYLLQRDK